MQHVMEESSNVLIIKLDKGERVMPSLLTVFEKLGIEHALVVQGIGMLEDIEIGYFDGESHRTRMIREAHELISLGGTVAQYRGGHSIHLHVSLGAVDGNVVGGHLKDGVVAVLAEIIVIVLGSAVLSRKLNPESNLAELDIGGDNL